MAWSKEVDDALFAKWMEEVDREVSARAGLSVYDLSDNVYRDMHDDGYTPEEAAKDSLAKEGFPF